MDSQTQEQWVHVVPPGLLCGVHRAVAAIAGEQNFRALIAHACSPVSPRVSLGGSLLQTQDVGASEVWGNPEGTNQSWHESHHLTHCLVDSRLAF